jgi:hypothetical protein
MIPRELERHDKFDPSTLGDLWLNGRAAARVRSIGDFESFHGTGTARLFTTTARWNMTVTAVERVVFEFT